MSIGYNFEMKIMNIKDSIGLLMETQAEVAELNEAILHADFILHEKAKSLTEAQIAKENQGFLKNIAIKLKAIIEKVRNTTFQVFNSVKARMIALWNKVTGRETIFINEEAYNSALELKDSFDEFYDIASSENKNSFILKTRIAKAMVKYANRLKRVPVIGRGRILTISKEKLDKLKKFLIISSTITAGITALLYKESKKLDGIIQPENRFIEEAITSDMTKVTQMKVQLINKLSTIFIQVSERVNKMMIISGVSKN